MLEIGVRKSRSRAIMSSRMNKRLARELGMRMHYLTRLRGLRPRPPSDTLSSTKQSYPPASSRVEDNVGCSLENPC